MENCIKSNRFTLKLEEKTARGKETDVVILAGSTTRLSSHGPLNDGATRPLRNVFLESFRRRFSYLAPEEIQHQKFEL